MNISRNVTMTSTFHFTRPWRIGYFFGIASDFGGLGWSSHPDWPVGVSLLQDTIVFVGRPALSPVARAAVTGHM
jgi:hypothetical protein